MWIFLANMRMSKPEVPKVGPSVAMFHEWDCVVTTALICDDVCSNSTYPLVKDCFTEEVPVGIYSPERTYSPHTMCSYLLRWEGLKKENTGNSRTVQVGLCIWPVTTGPVLKGRVQTAYVCGLQVGLYLVRTTWRQKANTPGTEEEDFF